MIMIYILSLKLLLTFNKLASESFTAKLAQANLASKSDIAYFVKRINSDDKLKNSIKNEVTEL